MSEKPCGILLFSKPSCSRGNTFVQFALRFAPYLFVRPSKLRRAEWPEFDLAGADASERTRHRRVPA
jgi:hypothetical protein